jgi:hypothetical protein
MSLILTEVQDFPEVTTTVLAAAATFTGTYKRVFYIPDATLSETPFHIPWARYITGVAYADQSGTLYVDQSNDGTTTHFTESFAVTSGSGGSAAFLRRIYAPYVRVKFTNGGTLQGDFSLFSILIGSV